MIDFIGRNALRIQVQVDVEFLAQELLVLRRIPFIADPRHRMFGAERFGQTARHHVHFVTVRHGNKNVGVADFRQRQDFGTAAITLDSQDVEGVLDNLAPLLILLDDDDIIVAVRQQFSNTVAGLADTYYYNAHKKITPSKGNGINLQYRLTILCSSRKFKKRAQKDDKKPLYALA